MSRESPRITTEPATAERWDDVVAVMRGGGDGGSCWCRWFAESSAAFSAATSAERRAALEQEIAAGPPRALIAYLDGTPAAWVRIAPRLEQPRLARSRIAKASPAAAEDPDVWAITCFQVRREHRGTGLVRRLIGAAVDFARANGASSVEGYPIDTAVTTKSSEDLFHGPASGFLASGFAEVARPSPARPVMVRRLQAGSRDAATARLES